MPLMVMTCVAGHCGTCDFSRSFAERTHARKYNTGITEHNVRFTTCSHTHTPIPQGWVVQQIIIINIVSKQCIGFFMYDLSLTWHEARAMLDVVLLGTHFRQLCARAFVLVPART